MKANERKPLLHNEGDRPAQLDALQLPDDPRRRLHAGRRRRRPRASGCRRRARPAPCWSARRTATREWVYSQQQTVSAEGFSGHSFSTYVPHTVRATETKHCTDCHVSKANDNNAWMAQLLMQGTNYFNFIGRYAYVAEGGKGLEAVVVTEREEPQAVIGSYLHKVAFPTAYDKHRAEGNLLREKVHHRGSRRARHLRQGRGAVHPAPRRVPLHRQRRGRIPRLRRGADRPEGLLRADRHRAGLAAGPAPLREDQVRHRGGLALHAGGRSDPDAAAGERGADDPPGLRVPLRDRPRGRAGRHRQPARQPQPAGRVDAAGRRSRQQLPGAGAGLQPRRPAQRRREHHAGRALRLRARCRRGSSSSTSTTRCSPGSWPPWASRTSSSRARSPCSSATRS